MPFAPLVAIPLAACLSAVLIVLLKPILQRYALARPNARSSHSVPTPQGAGIAIVLAILATGGLLASLMQPMPATMEALVLAHATLLLAIVGAVDDIRPLPATLRLGLQTLAVTGLVLSVEGRLLPEIPLIAERALAVLAGVWFVNLTNFMDGLDWMTVSAMVPVSAALMLAGLGGELPPLPTLVAASLLGALIGFAPFNRPVARLFLGDVGSLPIGLLVAWLLYRLGLQHGLAAAILLPLYYIADSTLTLLRRAAKGEPVWKAHRSHYYQRATSNGFTVTEVVGRVFVLNTMLAVLAGATLFWPSRLVTVAALAAGAALVAATLRRFSTLREGTAA
ncbi:glycosyltransferase family 4 protein [Methylobacterium sp. SD274]|uniref:MraY family glycosyltransferase n=1 Tax=Methylobacterium sp. SD274 TaxID=2782009 RepID=UPI001A96F4C1|nr:glycosyltransferase family 4 protein [Methylobacterium sp. SD274]MBO1018988.1 glycosyltransferase family 4 protein [Methylobacterium sp. SD274]